jgi:hypothetical protein
MKQSLLFLAAALVLCGQEAVHFGAKVYIHPMDGFGSYVYNAFRVKGVPVELVGRREAAEYELTGNEEREATAHKGMLRIPFLPSGGGRKVAVLRLQKVKTGEVLFTKTYGTDEANNGRRGGADACATDLEQKIRQQGVRRAVTTPVIVKPAVTAVRFTSQPADAELEVDGVFFGVTPTAELTRLQPGTHVIVVKKYGYERWEQKVEVAAGETRLVNAELHAAVAVPGKARIAGLE